MNNRRNQGGGGQGPHGRGKSGRRDGEASQHRARSTGSDPRGDRPPRGDSPQRGPARYSREDRPGESSQRGGGRFPQSSGRYSTGGEQGRGGGRFAPKGKDAKAKKTVSNVKIVSDLQITDGNHKGKYLLESPSPKGKVMDRHLREVLFRIIFKRLSGRRFVDLSAGTGMIGIEAISRGALIGSMVERRARMCSLIKKNLEKCEIKEGHGELFEMETVPFLKQMGKKRRKWDIVFFRPSYDENYDEVIAYLKRGTPIEKGGAVVIGHHAEMLFPEELGSLKRWRVVTEGDDALSFYQRRN